MRASRAIGFGGRATSLARGQLSAIEPHRLPSHQVSSWAHRATSLPSQAVSSQRHASRAACPRTWPLAEPSSHAVYPRIGPPLEAIEPGPSTLASSRLSWSIKWRPFPRQVSRPPPCCPVYTRELHVALAAVERGSPTRRCSGLASLAAELHIVRGSTTIVWTKASLPGTVRRHGRCDLKAEADDD